MEITLIRKSGKFNFEARNINGYTVEMDANPAIGGTGKGFRPMETLLIGLGGCSGIDMVNILTKQKEDLQDISIVIKATRKDQEIPPIFDVIDIQFNLKGNLSAQKVERALQMTFDKYCSAANILGRSATISFSYVIEL